MKFGYARVSTQEQSLDVQIKKLKDFGCDEIYSEKISGNSSLRPELEKLLSRLRKGDTLCVVRLDRLGRRMIQLIEFINDFKEKGIEFVSLDNHIDTSTPMGMLLFNICAAFSQMERELIKERVNAGLASAREKGNHGGRPTVLSPDKRQLLETLHLAGNMSSTQIYKTVGISRATYFREIKKIKKVA